MVTAVVIIIVFVYHVRVILKVSVNSITQLLFFIIGGNCQRCKHGFYGNPVNGGNCSGKNYLFQVDL